MSNRIAISTIGTSNSYINFGTPNEKHLVTKTKMVSIDGKYSISQQSFIQKLVINKRIDYKFYTKSLENYTDAFLSELLNANSDLFATEI
jgi:hypothetical protein